jgi:menaquinone-dependent protoporphyrinogen oxidase
MNKILVAFATMAGSTMEVAEAVGEEIAKSGAQVDVLPISEIEHLQAYDGVVVGGPMIMGWHREALRFLKKHRKAFQKIPLAVFVMAMSLTETDETPAEGVMVIIDEKLPKPPENKAELSFRERYARPSKYLAPILRATRPVKPVSIGVFGGRLEYGRLKWWAVLFAMLVIQAPAGDRRHWEMIRAWAGELPAALQVEERRVEG